MVYLWFPWHAYTSSQPPLREECLMESLPKSLQKRGCKALLNLSSRGGTPNGIVCCKEGKALLYLKRAFLDAKRGFF